MQHAACCMLPEAMRNVVVATSEGIVVDGELAGLGDANVSWLSRRAGGWVAIIAHRAIHLLDEEFQPVASAVLAGLRAESAAATSHGLVVGSSEAHLLSWPDLEPIAGFDEVAGREDWFTPWGAPADVRSIAAGPDGTTYVNVHVGGVVVSSDGTSWSDTMDIRNDVHEVIAHPDRAGVAMVAAAVGLGVTTDGADSWDWHEQGLAGSYMRAIAVSGSGVLASASAGSGGARAAVYRWDLDERGAFSKCTTGLPEWFGDNVDTNCVDLDGAEAVIGAPDGTVWHSSDGAESWEEAFRVEEVRAVFLA